MTKMSNGQHHIYTARSSTTSTATTTAAASSTDKEQPPKRRHRIISNNAAAGIATLLLPPPPRRTPTSTSSLQQRIRHNSKSTACILTTFLLLSFCFQFALLSYHDNNNDAQTLISSVKNEIVTDMEILDEGMVDMLNAAYEYNNNNNYFTDDDHHHHENNNEVSFDGIVSEIIETLSIQDFCGKCRYRDQDFNCNHRIEWVMKNTLKTEEEAKLADLKYCMEKKLLHGGSGISSSSGSHARGDPDADAAALALLHNGKWVSDKPNDSFSNNKAPFKLFDKSNWDRYSMEPLQILQRAGVDHTEGFIPSMTFRQAHKARREDIQIEKQEAKLPSLSEIQSLYGSKPYIVGLDRCQAYRDAVDPEFRLIGAAGLFNSATNLLGQLLRMNCINNARLRTKKYRPKDAPTGVKMQAPWGKHNPVSWRLHHEAKLGGAGTNQEEFLPIVMIKDPLTWMASMCRHSYEARWRHTLDHCPNLVANELDIGKKKGEIIPVFVKFATKHIGDEPMPDPKNRTLIKYNSLVELWNRWYMEWTAAEFPRLMVRFEDLLFHAEETISQICDCAGGTMRPRFRYVEDSAKGDYGPHAGSAGFLASLVTYGNSTKRMKDILTDEADYKYAKENLDMQLMRDFGYAPL
ncbi:hypothetical protein ACHAXM_004312 [Skeletonema potamos]